MDTDALTTDTALAAAWAYLTQAYDAFRAEGNADAARRALVLAKQTERLHSRIVKADNAALDAMLDVAAQAWGE